MVGIWLAMLGERKTSPPQPPGLRLGEAVEEEAVRCGATGLRRRREGRSSVAAQQHTRRGMNRGMFQSIIYRFLNFRKLGRKRKKKRMEGVRVVCHILFLFFLHGPYHL
jgi:hypothetical protein